MPIKRSSIKDVRRIKTRTVRNDQSRKTIRDLTKDLKKAVAANNKEEVKKLIPKLQKTLDKAAKNHVIHRNAASRKVGKVMSTIKKVK